MPSPLGHMLTGLVIGAVPAIKLKKLNIRRLLFSAFIAGAPDFDMLLVYVGVEYFYAHRTFTHSLITVLIVFLLLWTCNYLLTHIRSKYSIPYVLITVCLLFHIGMDMICADKYGPKGLMLFWPLSTHFFHTDLNVFASIADNNGVILPVKSLILVALREIAVVAAIGIPALILLRKNLGKEKNNEGK